MRGWLVVGAVLALLAAAAPARADSLVLVKESLLPSHPPETKVWQTPQASVEVGGTLDSVQVHVKFPEDPGRAYFLLLDPPAGERFSAGAVYDNIVDEGASPSGRLMVGGEGTSCSGGRYQVLDVATDAHGVLTRLWVLFSCNPERPSQFGELRFGMGDDTLAPAHVRWPASDAGYRGSDVPVTFTAPSAVTVTSVTRTGTDASAFAIAADGCTGSTLAAGARCAVKVAHRADTAGHELARLRFSLSDGSTREVVLDAFAFGGTTRLRIDSDPGDPVAGGADYEHRVGTAMWTAGGNMFGIGARTKLGDTEWDVAISPAPGDVLAPGTHGPAERIPFAYESPGLHANRTTGSSGHLCTQEFEDASFTIHEIREWPSGTTRSLSVSFVQRCTGADGELRGTLDVRTGDTTPLPPWMDQSAPPLPDGGGSVSFFSDPGDLVGQGEVRQFATPGDGMSVVPYGTGGGLLATAGGAFGVDVFVEPPHGEELREGVYDHAGPEGHGDEHHAELGIASDSLAGGWDGRFEILDLARGGDGAIERLWMVYESGAADSFGLRHAGEVRWGLPARPLLPALMRFPVVEAGRPGRVVPFTFTATATTQMGAADVAGSDGFVIRHDGCAGRTLAPGERCRVWVRPLPAAPGLAAATLRVPAGGTVHSSALQRFAWGGTTRVDMTGEEGDWISGGHTYAFRPDRARLFAAADETGLAIELRDPSSHWWLLGFPPQGEAMQAPATYSGAAWWLDDSAGPLMGVFTDAHACDHLEDSWFAVDELRRWAGGHVRSALVRFEQRCNGLPPLRGTWSFRAGDDTLPPPWVLTGADNSVPAGDDPEPRPTPTATPSPSPSPTATPAPAPQEEPHREPAEAPLTPGDPLAPPSFSEPPPPATAGEPAGPTSGCVPRRITINLRRRATARAVIRIDGRRVGTIGRGTRRIRISLTTAGRAVVTVRQGRRLLDRRTYRRSCA